MFHMLQCFIIYECDNSFPVCVCVWVEFHFISGEPTYDEFHAGDREAQPLSGKCSDRCNIGAWGFISYVTVPGTIQLIYVLHYQFDFFSFSMDVLVLSREYFIIYLEKFYYNVRKMNVNILPFLKCFYLNGLKLLINSTFLFLLLLIHICVGQRVSQVQFILGRDYLQDCLALVFVNFNSFSMHQETQEVACHYPKGTFFRPCNLILLNACSRSIRCWSN